MTTELITKQPLNVLLISEVFRGMNIHLLLTELKKFKNNGNHVIIVSTNKKNIIMEFINSFGISDVFNDIITPENLQQTNLIGNDLCGKNKLIQYYNQYNPVQKNNILLIDSDENNCKFADTFGYHAYHVKNETLTLQDAKFLLYMIIKSDFNVNNFHENPERLNSKQLNESVETYRNNTNLIMNIFNTINPVTREVYHNYTRERYMWICNWLGQCCVHANNCYVIEQLMLLWRVQTFNPFMDIISATNYIKQNTNEHIIRLSTTKPHNISITYFNAKENKPYHLRLNIDEEQRRTYFEISEIDICENKISDIIAKWKVEFGLFRSKQFMFPNSNQTIYVQTSQTPQSIQTNSQCNMLLTNIQNNMVDSITSSNPENIHRNKIVHVHIEDTDRPDIYFEEYCIERYNLENHLLGQLSMTDKEIIKYELINTSLKQTNEVYVSLPFEFILYINRNEVYKFFDDSMSDIYVKLMRETTGKIKYFSLGYRNGMIDTTMEYYLGFVDTV